MLMKSQANSPISVHYLAFVQAEARKNAEPTVQTTTRKVFYKRFIPNRKE